MTVRNALVAVAFAVVTLSGSAAIAQEARFELRDGDTVKAVLERQVGKRVSLVVPSSPEITGVVTRVGDRVVHLSELAGREFFDAVVSLDRISAVVIRVRGR